MTTEGLSVWSLGLQINVTKQVSLQTGTSLDWLYMWTHTHTHTCKVSKVRELCHLKMSTLVIAG